MHNNTKKAIIASSAALGAVASVAAISHITTKYLVSVALDRKPPKSTPSSRKKLTGITDESVFQIREETNPSKLEEKCTTVQITSFDNEKLVGHWYEAKNAKRVIVAMHGWRSSWTSDFGAISDFWHSNDCSVLYAEQRGQNNSGGGYMSFGLIERYDCLEWIKWVCEKTEGIVPVYLGGVSMGAATVLMTAGFNLPQCVCGIVADCGYTAPDQIWKHVMENNLKINYNMRKNTINKMCIKRLNCGAEDYSAIEAMKVCSVPVLFIHGTDDHFVPISMTYENYKACIAPKRLFIVPGAEHGMSYYVDKQGYESAVKSFWKDCEAKMLTKCKNN